MQHAEIAQNNLDWVERHNPGLGQADIAVKAAQVHATLALVEQQRIANLIAIYSGQDWTKATYVNQGIDFKNLIDEIKEGLGL